MNTTKKINVNVSSLVGLKAELLRKHTEVKDAKAKCDASKPSLANTKVKSKKVKVKNKGGEQKEKVTEIEDVDTLKKSKYMLVAKSRLYDKLKKDRGEGNENYLVDFKNKYSESSADESPIEDDYEDDNLDPDEDWVDYTDCFGRTRRCLRKDLPRMKEKDFLIEREITKKPQTEEVEERPQPPPFISPEKEPEIEIMRKKWEEQTEKLAHKSDIHYQDILFDEARTHGVGYYAFSHDEDERAKQQSNLAKLRKETEQKQKEMQEIKDLKSKMEENRLKTARVRARIRAGLPAEPTEEEVQNDPPKPESSTDKSPPEPKSPKKADGEDHIEKSQSNNEDSLIVIENKIKAFGELLGKRLPWRELSQEEWVDKRRKDRRGEFAPVYENFKSVGTLMTTKHNQLITKTNDDDPLQIHVGGPEPTDIWESSAPVYSRDANTAEGCDNLEKSSTVNQSTVSINCTEPPPLIQSMPPLTFNPCIPPPPVLSSIPPLPVPAVNSNLIPPPPVLYSIPPPFMSGFPLTGLHSDSSNFSLSQSQTIPDMSHAELKENSCMESSGDSDSDDSSDIIGPMPPPSSLSSIQDEILEQIPLPDNSAPTRIQDLSTEPFTTDLTNQSGNQNIDKVTAGLKYLRQKFETKNS